MKAIPVPEPTNLGTYVRNRTAAIALGKALFWDMQVGSDGVQACASCHFRAGADPRSINQLNPGGQDNPNMTVDMGLNRQLLAADFPLHKVADPTNRQSHGAALRGRRRLVGGRASAAVRARGTRARARTTTAPVADPVFSIDGINLRRAEPRNTPTVINAAFTHLNFWDRRARNIFNGVSVQGAGDENARVLRAPALTQIVPTIVRIDNASLASQAVGPPLSDREMGSLGRTFQDVGKRLVSAKPLRQPEGVDDRQRARAVRQSDDTDGLNTTYKQLIETAFEPVWWRSNLIVVVAPNGSLSFVPKPNRPLHDNEYTMMEYNFALYFGLSVQLYEMTLISDDAPIDRYLRGSDQRADGAGDPRHGGVHRRLGVRRLPLGRRDHRQLQAHPVRRDRRRRAAAGGTRRTHVQRRMRSGRLRSGHLQHRHPSHRRGSRARAATIRSAIR